ncbi:hypothetical protein FVER14953_07728 [Fusarium verticillioides]|nr:hypothetical protein FVER14953_07728 [Fusarium verticillioides]
MRVTATFGTLIMGASLCAARACVPHPRLTTTSSLTSETDTTTAGGAATTTTFQETISVTESALTIESSATVETSSADSATTELETTTSGVISHETLSVTVSQTSIESSATTTDGISSFTTILASTTAVTSQETETSTTVGDATSTAIEATTTTADPPVITELVVNGGFEDSAIDPWVVEGAIDSTIYTGNSFCPEGSHCLEIPGDLADSASVCQRVAVEAGFEYTFKAKVAQWCIKEFGSNAIRCDDNANKVELSIDGVFKSGQDGIIGSTQTFKDFTYTFSYTDPSIDSTDLCITLTQNQGISPAFNLDGVSFTRGQSVPIPDPTE